METQKPIRLSSLGAINLPVGSQVNEQLLAALEACLESGQLAPLTPNVIRIARNAILMAKGIQTPATEHGANVETHMAVKHPNTI